MQTFEFRVGFCFEMGRRESDLVRILFSQILGHLKAANTESVSISKGMYVPYRVKSEIQLSYQQQFGSLSGGAKLGESNNAM